jgi:hypothetical protein
MSTKDIYEKYRYDPNIISKSKGWYQQQANLLAKERINVNLFHKTHGDRVTQIVPGNLYMFFYDPKYKEVLPHYDQFPLVFPFEKTEDGFIGLNMHYLPYQLRIVLFDGLLKFKSTKGIDEKTRLRYSWGAIKGLARHDLAAKCVKRYLQNHLQSPLKMVAPTDWTTTLMLPVESFAKTRKNNIWGQ